MNDCMYVIKLLRIPYDIANAPAALNFKVSEDEHFTQLSMDEEAACVLLVQLRAILPIEKQELVRVPQGLNLEKSP